MKSFLPNIKNNQRKGFTLIELLVVIAIIAILAVVGFSVFTGAQAQARDGKRRAEIDALAKAIETSKDAATGVYAYTAVDLAADFPTNQPVDPRTDRFYCIASNTTSPVAPIAKATSNTLALNGCATPVGAYVPIGSGIPLAAGTRTWTLCAALERGATPFCVQSLQR